MLYNKTEMSTKKMKTLNTEVGKGSTTTAVGQLLFKITAGKIIDHNAFTVEL